VLGLWPGERVYGGVNPLPVQARSCAGRGRPVSVLSRKTPVGPETRLALSPGPMTVGGLGAQDAWA